MVKGKRTVIGILALLFLHSAYATVTFSGQLDLNNDGYADILFSNGYNDSTGLNINSTVYFGSATGFSVSNRLGLQTKGGYNNFLADFNQDGYLDVAFANNAEAGNVVNSSVYWGSATGPQPYNRTTFLTTGTVGVTAQDLDNNGYLDLIFGNSHNASNYLVNSTIFWNGPSGFNESNVTSLPTIGATEISAGDLNNDGYVDLLFGFLYDGSSYTGNSSLFWGSAQGFSADNVTKFPSLSATGVGIADLNNDGYKDIVLTNSINEVTGSYYLNSTLYWNQEGSFNLTNVTLFLTQGAFGGFSIADVNLDGYDEIIFSEGYDDDALPFVNSTLYWNTQGSFNTSNRTLFPTIGAYELSSGDLNNDGYPELVFAFYDNSSSSKINSTIYWNARGTFNTSNTTGLPTEGADGVSITGGSDDKYDGSTRIPDIGIANTNTLTSFLDLDIFFRSNTSFTITAYKNGAVFSNSNLTITVNSATHKVTLTPSVYGAGRIENIYFLALDSDNNVTSNNFSVHITGTPQTVVVSQTPSNSGGGGSSTYVTPKPLFVKPDCNTQTGTRERIGCRLEQKEELKIVDETCSSNNACRELHKESIPCLEMNGEGKDRCFKRVAGITNSHGKAEVRNYAVLILQDLAAKVEHAHTQEKITSEDAARLIMRLTLLKQALLEGTPKSKLDIPVQALKKDYAKVMHT